jgi:hypothetical protein
MFGNSYGGYQPFDFSHLQQGQMSNGMSPLLGQNMLGTATPDQSDPTQQHHHGGLGGILPYLAFGMLGGSLLGGGMGGMAPLFGLGGILAKKAGLFK